MEEGDLSGSAARAFTAKKNKKASGSLSDRIWSTGICSALTVVLFSLITVIIYRASSHHCLPLLMFLLLCGFVRSCEDVQQISNPNPNPNPIKVIKAEA
jgi:hypothetical protein